MVLLACAIGYSSLTTSAELLLSWMDARDVVELDLELAREFGPELDPELSICFSVVERGFLCCSWPLNLMSVDPNLTEGSSGGSMLPCLVAIA